MAHLILPKDLAWKALDGAPIYDGRGTGAEYVELDGRPVVQHANTLLEEIQKSLEEYLETKRMAFPRCVADLHEESVLT